MEEVSIVETKEAKLRATYARLRITNPDAADAMLKERYLLHLKSGNRIQLFPLGRNLSEWWKDPEKQKER